MKENCKKRKQQKKLYILTGENLTSLNVQQNHLAITLSL